ncbi:hypothetical protein [Amycolatopsis sp. WGS_07]|uniref:hypothetical protein n=1 Tax=Amycolatopsis sp. WGS_07 TaxID=3076764 RepID=UPI003873BDE1
MLVNEGPLRDPAKQKFLVLERWGGLDNAADYREQAQSLRRSLDSIEHIEKSYAQNQIVTMHKPEAAAAMTTIVAVDDNRELDSYIRGNVAHARMASQDRQVLPLTDWDDGRAELAALIHQMETLAETERGAAARGELRPFTDER